MIRLSNSAKRTPVPFVEHKRVALRAYTALAEMCNGTARREEWLDLADSVNVVEALRAIGKIDHDDVDVAVQSAIDGLMVAIKCPDGMMRMGQAATYAMRQLVTWHDEAIGKLSRGTMFEALDLVHQRIHDPNGCQANGLFVAKV